MVTSWNVRTLQDSGLEARRRTALIACELARYSFDIATLNEARLAEEGSIVEVRTGYMFFSGVAYPNISVAFVVSDLQLGLRFCRAPKNPLLQ